MCPSKRPLARMGSSRFTRAPSLIRENDVRFQVSWARSAPKDLGATSTAVRQTPLTAMLLPLFSSFASFVLETEMRRLPLFVAMRVMRPTSSIMPVNIEASLRQNYHNGSVRHGHQIPLLTGGISPRRLL